MALRPSGERWAVANDASGVATRVDRVQTLHPTLMVREATGGLERAVTSALAAAGLPVVVVNPRQARDFARATGQLANTEALAARRPDARAACPFGAPPATDRHAARGAEPPGGDERAPDEGYWCPYYVAQC